MDAFDDYPNASQNLATAPGSIFSIEKVQLQFVISNIVSFAVANNILCMALKTGRIIRIDLEHPQDVDGMQSCFPFFFNPANSCMFLFVFGSNYFYI